MIHLQEIYTATSRAHNPTRKDLINVVYSLKIRLLLLLLLPDNNSSHSITMYILLWEFRFSASSLWTHKQATIQIPKRMLAWCVLSLKMAHGRQTGHKNTNIAGHTVQSPDSVYNSSSSVKRIVITIVSKRRHSRASTPVTYGVENASASTHRLRSRPGAKGRRCNSVLLH